MDKLYESFRLLSSMDKELFQILGVTLRMSFFSTSISCILGIPTGIFLGKSRFRGRNLIKKIINTLMGLPPVVAGLLVYFLFTRYGPLGELRLLYTVTVMVIAQVILITPVVIALTSSVIGVNASHITETAKGMGLSKGRIFRLLLGENKVPLLSVVLTAFGRSIAEVGAVSLVGGNIQWKTRVMTTAILLETNKGNFSFALALGFVLLVLALIVNLLASLLVKEKNDD